MQTNGNKTVGGGVSERRKKQRLHNEGEGEAEETAQTYIIVEGQ